MQPNRAKNIVDQVRSFLGNGRLWWQLLNWMEIKINAVHSVNIGTTQQISISDHKTQSTEFGSLKLLQDVFVWIGTWKRGLVCVARNLRINWDNWGNPWGNNQKMTWGAGYNLLLILYNGVAINEKSRKLYCYHRCWL